MCLNSSIDRIKPRLSLFPLKGGASIFLSNMLRIAIQSKGRLHDDTMALLADMGVKAEKNKRTLLLTAKGFPMELLFMRDDDIPGVVANGTAHIGVVGLNEVLESGAEVRVMRPLGFGACRLSVAVPKDMRYESLETLRGKRIATSYPHILRKYLAEKGVDAEVQTIMGSVEISTAVGIADAIFDIVSSGSTLVSNHLMEVERVMESEAVLIGGMDLGEAELAACRELMFRMEAVRNAVDKKYVLMNAPADCVDQILAELPGMKSPTVVPLAQGGWCSIHAVVSESSLWEVVAKLKAKGAQGILVLPIEKMIY